MRVQPKWYANPLLWFSIGAIEFVVVAQLLRVVVPATWPLAGQIVIFLLAWSLVGTANYVFLRRARRL